ncbi:MAG: extracellular solute-binding protein [Lachnospiraceae bacterium]|nr:extracellular solute-binding protein [Lachnospiraceae bacterium]
MKKKAVSLVTAAVLALSLVACGGSGGNSGGAASTTSGGATEAASTAASESAGGEASTEAEPAGEASGDVIALKVWGPQEEQELLQEMTESFKAQYPDKNFAIELGVVGENDARTRYSEDPAAAADVFAFANDQLRDFVNAGGLYEVERPDDLAYINSEINGLAIDSATLDGAIWAYPETADNGYFLYYDSSVFDAADVDDLDSMLAKADAAGKKVFMDVSNGWYIASFFIGNGGTLALSESGAQVCDFNNEKGLAAAQGIQTFVESPAFLTGDDSVLIAGIQDGSIAAGVSGTWNAEAISEALGENYAATKLPKFTTGDGSKVQMASFGGTKLIGVNSQSAHPAEAMDLAMWLTNEENQVRRFEVRQIGPANIKAASSDAVKANIALAALAEQSMYAVSQKDVGGNYWTPAEAFGTALESGEAGDLQQLLDDMVEQITQ